MIEGIDWYVLGAIFALTLCSIFTRCFYMVFGDRFPLSSGVRSAFRYAPVAALVGIIVPELLPWSPDSGVVFDVRVPAAAIAVFLYLRTGSTLAVMIGGMVAFWALRFLFSVGI